MTIITIILLLTLCVLAPQIGFAAAFASVAIFIAFILGGAVYLIMWMWNGTRRVVGMFG
jgi:hypothetical protein